MPSWLPKAVLRSPVLPMRCPPGRMRLGIPCRFQCWTSPPFMSISSAPTSFAWKIV